MSDDSVVRMPRCPRCDTPPGLVIDVTQVIHADIDNGCAVLCWDMTDTPEHFEATAQYVDLTGQYQEPRS